MALFTLPKIYHPDFSNPRKKPTGLVEIDYNDPLSSALNSVIFEGFSLATKGTLGVLKTLSGNLGFGASSGASTEAWTFDKERPISTSPTQTVFIHFAQDTYAFSLSGKVYYAERPNPTQIFKIVHTQNGDVGWVIRNAANLGLQNFPINVRLDTTQILHSLMFVKAADDDRVMYADDNIGSFTDTSGGTYEDSDVTLLADPEDADVVAFEPNILVVYTFKRALTSAEYTALRRDPYRLLKPATSPVYFSASAVVGVNIPVIMNHLRNQGIS